MKRLALITLLFAGCTAEIPAGRLACDSAADCPPDWVCEGTPGRCQPDSADGGPDDGGALDGAMVDAAPVDGGPIDAGDVDAGPPPDAGPMLNACHGTAPLEAEPGEPCGMCGTGAWRCDPDDPDRVICGEDPSCWGPVASGDRHACAIRGEGMLFCWGSQAGGRLGNGETEGEATTPQPVDIDEEPTLLLAGGFVSVTAGEAHTCGVAADGSAWCWGPGGDGRLGNGTVDPHSRPHQVRDSTGTGFWTDWEELSAGGAHTCGRRANGKLYCWGRGDEGQLGRGSLAESRRPVEVAMAGGSAGSSGWDDWVMVVAGSNHTCGLRSDRSAWCWGSRTNGRLGDGETSGDVVTPSRVLADSGDPWEDWQVIGVGDAHSCGLRSGTIWCWGLGTDGRLGNGVAGESNNSRPVQVVHGGSARDWVSVSVGNRHSCALRSEEADVEAYCWGVGQDGRLGTGTDTNLSAPTPVVPPRANPDAFEGTRWLSVHAGGNRSFGRRSDGSLWAWGDGTDGARGDGTADPESSTPIEVDPD